MSVSGVLCRGVGSGDAEGCGVGRGGCSSGGSGTIETRDARLLRAARASLTLRRLGGAVLVGESGSAITLSGGLNICDGSISDNFTSEASTVSPVLVRLPAVVLRRGVVTSPFVFRRGDDRVLRAGAGANSSPSSSSSRLRLAMLFSTPELSSSSSSTTTFLRAAARRDGRSGGAADMATVFSADLLFGCDEAVVANTRSCAVASVYSARKQTPLTRVSASRALARESCRHFRSRVGAARASRQTFRKASRALLQTKCRYTTFLEGRVCALQHSM